MSTSSCGRRYEGRRCEGWLAFWEAASGGDLQDREEHVAARCDRKSKRERERKRREKRRRGAAPRRARRARESEKGKNERGGETGKRDEAEIQKVLTSQGKIVFIRGLKLKRSEKTATRKPAKWRGLTKASLIYLFFCRARENFETDTTAGIHRRK